MLTHGHGDKEDAVDGDGKELRWGTAALADLPYLLETACYALAERGPESNIGSPASIKEATSAMLLVLHAICIAGEEAQVQLTLAWHVRTAFSLWQFLDRVQI